jgi:tetratricopeptide (TPR) repeat protein
MKKNSWLNALENLSLVSLGAGSVASLLLKQAFYTTTPLSLLVVLGLLNRRRLAQLVEQRDTNLAETDQFLTLQVDRLRQQVSTLPTPEAFNRLNRTLAIKNQEVAEKLHREMATLKQGTHQRLVTIENQGLGEIRQDVRQLAERCSDLMQTVSQLGTDLGHLSTQVQAEGIQTTVAHLKQDVAALQANLESLTYQTKPNLTALQEQITRLDRQLSKLPPPVDTGSLKQEVAELIRIVADLVPRRDLSGLVSEIRDLQQEQETLKQAIVAIETAALNFRRTFSKLPKSTELSEDGWHEFNGSKSDPMFSDTPDGTPDGTPDDRPVERAALTEHPAALMRLKPPSSSVYPELQELAAHYLGNLRSQISTIQEFAAHLGQQQKQLRDQLNQLPQTLDVVALQQQFMELSQRIPVSESAIESFKLRIQEVLHQELDYINQQLHIVAATPHSELIFDLYPVDEPSESESPVAGSRAVLEQALASTQNRLILIWPWSGQCQLDENLFQQFETFLSQQRQLEIGWCYLADRKEERWLGKMQRGWMTDLTQRSQLQETLQKLLQLKRIYPEQFQFKILGTSENFLVSDDAFAVLGIADALKTTTPFPELQLKLKTTDAGVIQRLIHRFDDSTLNPDDLTAYWNRAVTRYDLGDKVGAIADYSHILSIMPDDAIAYNYRGLAHYDLGDCPAAMADFSESIRLYPQQTAAYCNRAFLQSEQGNHWEAIGDYTLAAQTNCPIAYFYRGMTQQKLENHAAAIADYSEAIRLAPDVPVAYYYRGLAWQKLENLSEAITDFEWAAQFFWVRGSKTNAQKALKNVAKLRQEISRTLDAAESEATSEAVYRS